MSKKLFVTILILLCSMSVFACTGCGGRQTLKAINAISLTSMDGMEIDCKVYKAVNNRSTSVFSTGDLQQYQIMIRSYNNQTETYETEIRDNYLFIKKITAEKTNYYMILDNLADEATAKDSRYIFFGMAAYLDYGNEHNPLQILAPYQFLPQFGYNISMATERVKLDTDYLLKGTWEDIQAFYSPFLGGYVETIDENMIVMKGCEFFGGKFFDGTVQLVNKGDNMIQFHVIA